MRRLWLVLFGGVVLALLSLAAYVWTGADSACRTHSDCAPGQECLAVTIPGRSGFARLRTPRSCETPCRKDEDCPQGYGCWTVDHGPGPGPICLKARPK
jgi:hypothetical protein